MTYPTLKEDDVNVKQLIRKYMDGVKNAKISADLHKRLRMFAALNGLQIGLVIEAACEVGLKDPRAVKRLAEAHTTVAEAKARVR